MKGLRLIAAIVALSPASANIVSAHARSVAYSSWLIDGTHASVTLQITKIDQNALLANLSRQDALTGRHDTHPDAELQETFQRAVVLHDARHPCTPIAGTFYPLKARFGWARFDWQVHCGAAPTHARIDLLFDEVSGHLHITTFATPGHRSTREWVLSDYHRVASVPTQATRHPTLKTIASFVAAGIGHILSGWDHLAFVFTLILLATSLRELSLAITGFTLGHSLTLALSVLGLAATNPSTVESLIGLSIALLAVENIWISSPGLGSRQLWSMFAVILATAALSGVLGNGLGISLTGVALFVACNLTLMRRISRPALLRGAVAALFGLIHGFGFAGALKEQLPDSGAVAAPLFGFNLGVEVGQLAVVVLVWPLLQLVGAEHRRRAVIQFGSVATLALGTYWFVSRAFL